jgi:signal transduction histidine kinase
MKYIFSELIDINELQSLLESFTTATGFGTAILDLEGQILTGTGWSDICTKFHRIHPLTSKRCTESDTVLASQLNKGERYNIYKCKNGLIDVAVPIIIEGIHMGNLFTGQLLFDLPDVDYFKEQAKEFGFDESLYLEALNNMPVFTEDKIRQTMEFLLKLAKMIGNLGLAKKQQLERNVQISDLLTIKEKLNRELIDEKEKLEILTEELQKSNQELDDFAYIASHDLREPLRGINNYSNFLLEDYSDKLDDEGKTMLSTVSKLANRLEQFIDSLLFFSRLGRTSTERQVVLIREIIDDVVNSFEFAIQERPTVINIMANHLEINCDRLRVTEIYKNLIGNALKYNDKAERYIEVGYLFTESGAPILYVKDNGIGIEEKHFKNIFTIFKRLHPRDKYGGGTGAGLTIAKKCVVLQGGEIWIESEFKEGTTFYFTVTEEKNITISEEDTNED